MNTKALRQKILDLAIHGKLVPQDPNDEPASVLLERIKAEKERLIKEGKIKRAKRSKVACDKPHYPYDLPKGWCWTNVGNIASSILYGVSESAKSEGEYRLLRITDIQGNAVNWETVPYTDFDESKVSDYLLNDGDILFARTGATVGKSYLVHGIKCKAIYASYLIRVQTFREVLPEYVKYFFESGFYWEQIQSSSVGIGQPNVNGTILSQLMMPIPPKEEQLRIVNNLRDWLNIVDVIDGNKESLQTSIKQVKSKILDLTIHGKLVPQDPTDEPAAELLKRINPKTEFACDNAQYGNLPNGWCECNLSSLCKIKGGKRIPRGQTFSKAKTPHIYIRVSDMKNNTIVATDLKYIDDDVYQTIKNYTISSSDLYLTIAGTIGNVGYVPKQFDGMNLTENAAKLTNIICDKKFLMYSLLSSKAQEHFKSRFHQVAQPKLSIETANSTIVCLPPLNEQHRIVAKIEELFALLDNIASAL